MIVLPRAAYAAWIASITLTFGCQKASATTSESSATPSASVAVTSAPSSARSLGALPVLPPEGMQSIPERFASEAKNRPTGTVRVEDVFAAFQSAGATLREERQHLASPFLAAYCVGVQTGADVHVSVCEYKDAAKAQNGKKMSEQAFSAVPNRALHLNGATTLTVRVGGTSAQDRELAKRLAETFAGLSAKK